MVATGDAPQMMAAIDAKIGMIGDIGETRHFPSGGTRLEIACYYHPGKPLAIARCLAAKSTLHYLRLKPAPAV